MTRFDRTDLRRLAVALLDQQLWCLGRDVTRIGGNVLAELGMCRYRSQDGRGSTAYTGRVARDGVVWLWGFGLLYWQPDRGGMFLRRYGFDPVLVAEPKNPVHRPEYLAPFTRPNSARQRATASDLVRSAAVWVAGYEHRVAERFGTIYREAMLAARDKPPAVPAKEMARAWEHLAKKSVRLSGPAPLPRGPWGQLLATLRTPGDALSSRAKVRYIPNTQRRFPIS